MDATDEHEPDEPTTAVDFSEAVRAWQEVAFEDFSEWAGKAITDAVGVRAMMEDAERTVLSLSGTSTVEELEDLFRERPAFDIPEVPEFELPAVTATVEAAQEQRRRDLATQGLLDAIRQHLERAEHDRQRDRPWDLTIRLFAVVGVIATLVGTIAVVA